MPMQINPVEKETPKPDTIEAKEDNKADLKHKDSDRN